mgnify:CR=1 FL=1
MLGGWAVFADNMSLHNTTNACRFILFQNQCDNFCGMSQSISCSCRVAVGMSQAVSRFKKSARQLLWDVPRDFVFLLRAVDTLCGLFRSLAPAAESRD